MRTILIKNATIINENKQEFNQKSVFTNDVSFNGDVTFKNDVTYGTSINFADQSGTMYVKNNSPYKPISIIGFNYRKESVIFL